MKDIDWVDIAFAVGLVLLFGSCTWENVKLAEYCISKGLVRNGDGCVAIRVKP